MSEKSCSSSSNSSSDMSIKAWSPDPRIPKIIVLATITPSVFSLSEAHAQSLDISLDLTLHLANSTVPISMTFDDGFLALEQPGLEKALNSAYGLCTPDGQHMPEMYIHALRITGRSKRIDADTNLVTIYPGIPKKWRVRVGIVDAGPNRNLLCGVPLPFLRAGTRYKVTLPARDLNCGVEWWGCGDKETIVKEKVSWWNWLRGKNEFVVPASEWRMGRGVDWDLNVELVEGPEILVLD